MHLDRRRGTRRRLDILAYELDPRRDSLPSANFGRFEPEFGNVHDQHYWLPFFGFDPAESVAELRLTITAPTDVHFVTGLTQRATIIADPRAVVANLLSDGWAMFAERARGIHARPSERLSR